MRFDLLEGDRLTAIDVEQKDGALICPILVCLRQVKTIEILGGFQVKVPPELVDNKLPQALLNVKLKIVE